MLPLKKSQGTQNHTMSANTVTILSEDTIKSTVKRLAQEIDANHSSDEPLALVAILSGAAYFLVDLSRELKSPHTVHFVQASSYHNINQDTVTVNGLPLKDIKVIKDRNIIVLDELYDNGKTLDSIVTYLTDDLGVDKDQIETCVIFRKNRRGKSEYSPPDYCGIDNLPDVWFIGYGLDDNGTKRNLQTLVGVAKPPGVPISEDEIIFTSQEAYTEMYTTFNRTF